VFLREDFNGVEVRGETGALELGGLLDGITFGDENEAMTRRELGEGFRDAREQFDLVVSDGIRESKDTLALIVCDGLAGELLEAIHERAAEAAQTATVSSDGGVFAAIQMLANLCRRVGLMIEIGDERSYRTFKVDVVLP